MAWMERRMLLLLLLHRTLPLDRFRYRATVMLRRFERDGIVELNATHVTLTRQGILIARRMKKRGAEKAKDGAKRKDAVEDEG